MQTIILLALFTAATCFAQASTGFIIAGTFNLKNNDSLAAVLPNGVISKQNMVGQMIESYSNFAMDPKNRTLYCLGTSDQPFFDTYNADTLQFENEVFVPSQYAIIDLQFDTQWNKLLGVMGTATGFAIVDIDVKTGQALELVTVADDVQAISEDSNAYDSINHRYFISAITNESVYLQYNLQTRTLEKTYQNAPEMVNTEYHIASNSIVGIHNDSFCMYDLKTGKFAELINLQQYGFRELGVSAIDNTNGYYFTLFETHQAIPTWIAVNIKQLSFTGTRWYNHIGAMVFVPPK